MKEYVGQGVRKENEHLVWHTAMEIHNKLGHLHNEVGLNSAEICSIISLALSAAMVCTYDIDELELAKAAMQNVMDVAVANLPMWHKHFDRIEREQEGKEHLDA